MQYFKDKIGSNGVLFLQETHSDSKVEQNWKKDFKGPIFFFLTESQILVASQLLILEQENLPLKSNKQIRKVVF